MTALPNFFPLGWYLTTAPTLLAYRLTGFVPKTFRYPFEGEVSVAVEASARQTFFDEVVEQHLGNISQFVILGAGFDTRAYRLSKNVRVKCFEVDVPRTQAIKRELLQKTALIQLESPSCLRTLKRRTGLRG